ncbi:copper resistance CopC family protein [Alkalimonas amylolytica]|uniref:CopC domain-containing protein n=1 Tax=Alkalimonas amylolytica TaxID=152573 RepID=A0A1H4BIH7_ALKAM|nr:copper resistance CopC family protein [Alkalimonas amylolytica]SEA47930.1 hypothetical protein SAMN04488051_103378 [Alkalimonas amylolytica]
MNRFMMFFALVILCFAPAKVLAHTPMQFSIPADGAVLNESTAVVMLHFGDPVRMLSLDLTHQDQAIEFGFERNRQPTDHIEFPLPTLAPGHYQLEWAALGADGHRVSGTISFQIDPDAEASNPEPEPESESHQHHHHAMLAETSSELKS